jgi:hypothetical protein
MHNSLGMHVFQTWEKAKHKLFDLICGEVSIVLLDLMEKLSSSKQL